MENNTINIDVKEVNKKELEEKYKEIIVRKMAEGFTIDQIAADLGLPVEVLTPISGEVTIDEIEASIDKKAQENILPDNPTENDVEKPFIAEQDYKQDVPKNDTDENVENMEPVDDTPIKEEVEHREMENSSKSEENSGSNSNFKKEEYTLENTIEDMLSPDYRIRLRAEYAQTKIRHSKLVQYIVDVANGDAKPFESVHLLMIQADAMQTYLTVMQSRMDIIAEMDRMNEEDENKEKEQTDSENINQNVEEK